MVDLIIHGLLRVKEGGGSETLLSVEDGTRSERERGRERLSSGVDVTS